MKINRVLGSRNPHLIWDLSNDLFLMPVSLPATRFTAMRRSRWLRNAALEGESGSRNQMTKAQRHVAPPSCFQVSCAMDYEQCGDTYDVEDQLPTLRLHIQR